LLKKHPWLGDISGEMIAMTSCTYPVIRLGRQCRVRAAQFTAEVRIHEENPIIVFLEFCEEQSARSEPFTPASIARGLFGNAVREGVGRRIMKRLEDLELVRPDKERRSMSSDRLPDVDEPFVLTDIGKQALEERKIPVPERGDYEILYIEDPLYPSAIVSMSRVSGEKLHDIAMQGNDRGEKETDNKEIELPPILENIVGREIYILEGDLKGPVRIDRFERDGIRLTTTEKVYVELKILGTDSVEGLLFHNRNKFPFRPEITETIPRRNLRDEILEQHPDWEWYSEAQSYIVYYDQIDDSERRSKKANVTIIEPTLDDLGDFEDVEVADVPLIPARQQDAQDWYQFLVVDSINGYMTEEKLRERARSIKEECEKEWEFRLRLMANREILSAARKDRLKFWFVIAPRDLPLVTEG